MKLFFVVYCVGALLGAFFLSPQTLFAESEIDVVIVGAMYDSVTSGSDHNDEWIRLFNNYYDEVDISDWYMRDGSGEYYVFPDDTVIQSGEYLFLENLPFELNNSGDLLELCSGECDGTNQKSFVAWESYVDGWDIEAQTNEGEIVCRLDITEINTQDDWTDDQGVCENVIYEIQDRPQFQNYSRITNRPNQGRRVRFVCRDFQSINFSRFGRHYQKICRY